MKRTTSRMALAVAVLSFIIGAGSDARASILPKNNLHLQDNFAASNMTEEQFNTITDNIVEMWKPLAEMHGAKLVAVKDWNNSEVNAYAEQRGKEWRILMFGGLARRPEVSLDGFALVVCHELGHHFGGYPFKRGDWAASEGQSDYWATQVCGRRIWLKSVEKNERLVRKQKPRLANACNTIWKTDEEKALCARVTEAGLSLAKLLGALGGEKAPSLDVRDMNEVEKTNVSHPKSQCRLDTYLHGALCTQFGDLKVIPGKKGSVNPNDASAETEAGRLSCMQSDNFKVGYRPRCWFKEVRSKVSELSDDVAVAEDYTGWEW